MRSRLGEEQYGGPEVNVLVGPQLDKGEPVASGQKQKHLRML